MKALREEKTRSASLHGTTSLQACLATPSFFVHALGSPVVALRSLMIAFAFLIALASAESEGGAQEMALPDTPKPQFTISTTPQAEESSPIRGTVPGPMVFRPSQTLCGTDAMSSVKGPPMSCWTDANPFQRFLNGGMAKPLTARQKFRLAAKNVGDPFNLLTIAGDAAISVGSNSHSRYGPGMQGWAKYSGVSLTQDMTAEFFVTFLVPSIAHQDPHFHRIPNASYMRRAAHCITQVVWAQSDTGNPMPNYAYLFGIAAADTISNIYVPGRDQGTWPTAARVAVALGSAPIDNFITEFLPDVARHVSIRIVLIQRIINRVALTEGQQ